MFGKGGGALGAWIKEFCELVFVQTLQAFIYALAVGLIMQMNVEAMKTDDASSVLGLMCIVCLTAIFKVEDILRRILGFGPTKADHGNAVKSVAKTAFAMKLGKRVLDNGGKVIGGAKNMIGANKDAKNSLKRLERRKQALKMDNGIDTDDDSYNKVVSGTTGIATSGTSQFVTSQRKIDSQKRNEKIQLFNDAQRARKLAQTETDPNKKKALMEQAKLKLAQAKSIDDTLKDNSSNNKGLIGSSLPASATGITSSSSASSNISGKKPTTGNYYQSMQNLKEQYDKELSDAKKKRKEGFRTMTRGFAETAGAVIGGTAGGILGFADGNIDEGLQGMVSGAGLGDLTGSAASSLAFGATDLVEGAINTTSKAVGDYASNIKSQYEEEKKNAEAQIRESNKNASNEINRINKNGESARADLEKEINMSAGQTAKVIAKSIGKGSAKAYKSRHGGIRQLENGLKDLEKNINSSSEKIKLDNSVESID